MFYLGNVLKLSLFGSSHGESVGSLVDGFPVGYKIPLDYIQKYMEYRRPGNTIITSQRKEEDVVKIISGMHNGFTDGSPITMIIENKNVISSYYEELKENPRPGHSDYTLYVKYGDFRNYEGGGFLSGRMTAPLVAAGALAKSYLDSLGIKITSYMKSIGEVTCDEIRGDPYNFETRIPDPEKNSLATSLLVDIMKSGDSIGGRIDTIVEGLPPGVGEPFFNSVESEISRAMFSIPAVKAIEFGDGFTLSKMKGSEANDPFTVLDGHILTKTNHNGGILGGMTTGMPVKFSIAVKPTPSIHKKQDTINLISKEKSEITVKGRHDPCVAIRAVPVVECLTAFVLMDLMMMGGFIDRYGNVRGRSLL
ncbi:chorismate synthase [Thermoplasma volcanium]|nr:chorismate synthase [Thermoplasma volcanium]